MSIFEYVSVAISIILGLGVAQLLSAGLSLYRARRRVQFHWIPLAWAATILLLQLTFWWQMFSLNQDPAVWNYGTFLLTALMATTLFAAGGLILPPRYPQGELALIDHFMADGKAGVGAFAVFHVVVVPLNLVMWDTPLLAALTGWIILMAVVKFAVLFCRTTRAVGTLTVLYVIVQVAVLIGIVDPGSS